MREELIRFGRKLAAAGLTHARFGNMSVRIGGRILITKSGSMLEELEETQLVEVDLSQGGSSDSIASTETIVHRAIYQATSARAVIHSHSPFAVIISLLTQKDSLIPLDCESLHTLGEIPLISAPPGSAELAEKAAAALSDRKACIIRGHGPVAAGKTVEEAFVNVCSVEHACKVKYYVDLYGAGGKSPSPKLRRPGLLPNEERGSIM
jgi:L-fuculose-phosphate aldolase